MFLDAIASLEVGYVRVSVRCHQFVTIVQKLINFEDFKVFEVWDSKNLLVWQFNTYKTLTFDTFCQARVQVGPG